MGLYMDNKTAIVKYYNMNPDTTDFHYAWRGPADSIIVAEFNSANWPMVVVKSYGSVREYLQSINDNSDMTLFDSVIDELYNLMDKEGLSEVPELEWLKEKR